MCNPLTNKFPIPPPKKPEELLALKEKRDAERLEKLRKEHKDMEFIKDNMR